MLVRTIDTWAMNLSNIAVFLCSRGKKVLHNGRYKDGVWIAWNRMVRCRPRTYERPASEKDICRFVAKARKVRVVGGGHSFNAAPLSDDLLLSLDRFNVVDSVQDDPQDPEHKIVDVRAGMRLCDLNVFLAGRKLALPVAGSTDQQSIGGLISTDLHGTGRDNGFLSQCVVSLRIVDAHGNARTFRPDHPVFHAAIGGLGTCGVIIGAEIRVARAYNLTKTVRVLDRAYVEENLDSLLEENDHLSLYYLAGLARRTEQLGMRQVALVRMNKWNRTVEPPNRCRRRIKFLDELVDVAVSGHLLEVARAMHRANWLARQGMRLYAMTVEHRSVIYSAEEAFARRIFFAHDEIEYGIPREHFLKCINAVYRMVSDRCFPTVIEVRFTPPKSQAMLGPGVGRPTAYIELATSLSRDTDKVFREFERIVLEYGGRPHLGKKVYLDREQMDAVYGMETMRDFREARREQDASGKFMNEFTERILGG